MPAYNLHRKILELPSNSTDMCLLCDPLQNQTANCIPICSDLCPFNCNTTDSYLPLPPSTGGYFINTPPQQNHHHSPLSLPLKISLVILVLTFSLFLLYTLYKFYTIWYRSRRRGGGGLHAPPPPPEAEETRDEFVDHDVLDHPIWYIRTIGLQPSVISAITVVKYNKSEGLIDGASCSVCLSDFQEDETLRLLPKCNHAFHISCIDTWLRSHTNCPLCRAGIVKSVDDLGQIEDTQVAISITEDENGGQSQREDVNQSSEFTISVLDDENKQEIGGGSAIIRRSVSLDDYAAFRVRSDVLNNNNNNYFSDRHDVQIQPVDGDLRFELIKVDRTVNNRSVEP